VVCYRAWAPASVLPAAAARVSPPQGEAKGFTWSDYLDLIIAAHRQLARPPPWCWDNLNVHLAPELVRALFMASLS
jgi:hypothetical protein